MRIRTILAVAAMAALLGATQAAEAACPKCVAEEITTANAAKHLLGGSDPAGGIGDWYLTNKKVELIVDDIGTIDADIAGGGTVPITVTSSNAVATGGTLVDVGLFNQNNDQLPGSFNVSGLSLDNVLLFRQGDEAIWGATSNPCLSVSGSGTECPSGPDCASITVYGISLFPGVSSVTAPALFARTRYEVCDGEQQVRMRTEIWNQSGSPAGPLPVIDVFLWGGRGIDAFVPATARGYNHPELDLANAANLLVTSPYWFAPGNVHKKDGRVSRNKIAKEVSYGHLGGIGATPIAQDDPDGPLNPMPPANIPFLDPRLQIGLHGNLLSGAIVPVLSGTVPDGASRVFSRVLVVGKRNDGHSVTGDPKNKQNIFGQLGYPTGTVRGSVRPRSKDEGTVTFIRTSGSALTPPIAANSPVTSIRAKGGFKVVLPIGNYIARTVFPGRDDIISDPFEVIGGNSNLIIDASGLDKVGIVTATIVDADTNQPIPAKVSFSPSPVFRRDFEAFNFDLRTGMCSNALNGPACTADAACGGGNTCFRTCSNQEPKRCQNVGECEPGELCASDNRCRSNDCADDAACGAGYKCVADTASIGAEGFPGGSAQLNVIYTSNGKIKQNIKPDTYTATVSRGLEYSVRQFPVEVEPGKKVDIGGGSPISLKRVVDTTGWVSADFHIHSARSLDSSAPLEARVQSFAAEGVEVMVATDHDIVTDYIPAIQKMKLTPFVASIVGTEVTTSVGTPPYFSNAWGHVNAWPQIFDPDLRRSGSAEDENASLNVVLDRLRASMAVSNNLQCIGGSRTGRPCSIPQDCKGGGVCTDVGPPVIQFNHVRAGVSGVVNIGFFDNIGYDPAALITDCQKYPVICPTSNCFNGTNDGTTCTSNGDCTGGGVCGCVSASVPAMANGCNEMLLDLNVIPQAALCTTPGCGSGFELASGTRNIDADVMEVDNGGNASGWGSTKAMRRDWMSLLNQGVEVGAPGNRHPLWATGVSDTHRLVAELPGYSRTFVEAGDLPNPGLGLDIKNFNEQVVAGKMFGSAGPVLDVTADNTSVTVGLGETLDASGGNVNLNIEVKAAPWIPVDEVRVIKNGCVIACFNDLTAPAVSAQPAFDDQTAAGVVRFTGVIPDAVTEDSYYVIEASPNLPASGSPAVDPIVNAVAAGAFPFAFTNPIFADFDGSGYEGLATVPPVCPALPASCSAGAAVASAPAETMFASVDPQKDLSWFGRLLEAILPSVQAHEAENRPDDEEERLREHEERIRKAGDEYFPRQFFVIPTPAPKPEGEAAGQQE
jgi:hypothetical protein